jgi:hypothetical protein
LNYGIAKHYEVRVTVGICGKYRRRSTVKLCKLDHVERVAVNVIYASEYNGKYTITKVVPVEHL